MFESSKVISVMEILVYFVQLRWAIFGDEPFVVFNDFTCFRVYLRNSVTVVKVHCLRICSVLPWQCALR